MKRFVDTELWDKDWFMDLPQKHKLLIQFLFSKCDAAGVWNPNYILASTYVGNKINIDDIKALKNQLEIMPDGKIFIPDFIFFQYGELTETCMPHRKVISLLKNYGLFERVSEGYQKGIYTLQDKDKEEDKEKEEEISNTRARKKPMGFAAPTLQEVVDYFLEFGYMEESAIKAWHYYETAKWKDSGGKSVKNWKQKMHGVWFKPENKNPSENKKFTPPTFVP